MTVDPLISTAAAAELIDEQGQADAPRLVLLDVRWQLGNDHTHDEYLAAHLPGAIYVDLDDELADPATPQLGRHPLPSAERFQRAVRRWGLRPDDVVVVYDDVSGTAATRAWWLLRDAGFESVRLLDGVLAKWRAEGRPLQSGDVAAADDGTVTVRFGHLPTVTMDEAGHLPQQGTLVDIRARERYRGESEPVDPQAGHIPGAVNAPTDENLADDGTFRPASELRDRFAGLGVDGSTPTAVHCGSGVSATHTILALSIAGIDAALYPGSWSQWSLTPGRPVATGPLT
ncbi:sulfurtransferase [Pseudoclavibacter sp. 13-3]|uniref:sulfurtransferase n=1 Tax=Pseudoclavibacter sp. 13-3 TaxID=2901228 RepID=UPI001E45F543|nr:sulfurtransferase [Pseudoclavibacter sp. 13-3]MCD7100976.1 sulfurtransferase [Pseudoclavibacter sp. 13-3]